MIEDKAIVLRRIENAIRWHYYDVERGNHSADPSRSGIDDDVLEGLIECLDEPLKAGELALQGKALANIELKMPYEAPSYGKIEWVEVSKLIDVMKP